VVYSGLAEKWSRFQETMDKIQEIRMEVAQQTRKNTQKKAERLSHGFKKTSLKKVIQTA